MPLHHGPVSPASALGSTVVPVPAQVFPSVATFTLSVSAAIFASREASEVAQYLSALLRPPTGYNLPISTNTPSGGIALLIDRAVTGYRMEVTDSAITIRASTAEGLFHGVQTLRQSLPAAIERRTLQAGPWTVPGGVINDRPRFQYRGAMLDVARHFMDVATVMRYIDDLALYKINTLHLHLTDDQGWRIEIDSWPCLATYGGSIEVGGGQGGYYTKDQYRDLVEYARNRFIAIIPRSIARPHQCCSRLLRGTQLRRRGFPLFAGTDVGFSSLCVSKEVVYQFVDEVIRELAAVSPSPYIHIGGDEALSTTLVDYVTFMERVMPIVSNYGKRVMGWNEITKAETVGDVSAQYWATGISDFSIAAAVQRGAKVLMSPANKAYLDMKYDESTPYGLAWAGFIEVRTAYDWDPGAHLAGVPGPRSWALRPRCGRRQSIGSSR